MKQRTREPAARRRAACALPLALLLLGACYRGPEPPPNPAAEGFDAAGSDASAVRIADDVMLALGGRDAWDATHVIGWTFRGERRLLWDKHAQRARIDYLKLDPPVRVALDLESRAGRAWRAGQPVTDPAELKRLCEQAYAHWVNDSYWLVMPYKLKDSGVTLRHAGERQVAPGHMADVLELTFGGVGLTPDNRYEVLVSRRYKLPVGWSYFPTRDAPAPQFSLPWLDWEWYGGIQLSGNRRDVQLTEIHVRTEPPPDLMTAPGPARA